MSGWQDQETSTTRPLLPILLVRQTLGDFFIDQVPHTVLPESTQKNTSCLRDLEQISQESLVLLVLTWWEV